MTSPRWVDDLDVPVEVTKEGDEAASETKAEIADEAGDR